MAFSGKLGTIKLGAYELSKVPVTTPPIAFVCNSILSIAFDVEVISSRFSANFTTSVSFRGESHIDARLNFVSGRSFIGSGRNLGSFTVACTSNRTFIDSVVRWPHLNIDSRTDVQFFVRNGQSPDCYYDNATFTVSSIRNYVF